MFAVKGWSVSADKLKSETATPQQSQSNGDGSAPQKSKKRKRNNKDKSEEVTAANVADLYGSVVEGIKIEKDGPKNKKQKKEVQDGTEVNEKKKSKKDKKKDKQNGEKPQQKSEAPTPIQEGKKDKKSKKDKKQPALDPTAQDDEATTSSAADDIPPLPPAPPKLTPLQASMRQKLISARFRHLNETLYTRPSAEAFTLFQDSPEMFGEYHEGFRRQVTVWPENPVDSFLADIRARGKVKQPGKGSGGYAPGAKQALPRTGKVCTIADLGCGDARLAEELQKDGKKMNVAVKSYDLQSPSKLVTKADIANLPLADGSVNVTIFCLALMGTNWIDFIEEAYRILHWKGELWVAEIKSRFGPIRKNNVVTHSVGNRKKAGKKGKTVEEDEGVFEDDLAVEVDGQDDRRRETDVSAFVEVLRKRGFVLQGEKNEAIDLSNKMFVKMHFVKGAAPVKGKGVKAEEPKQKGKQMKKWAPNRDLLEEAEDEADANEASVLKPCVYKIR